MKLVSALLLSALTVGCSSNVGANKELRASRLAVLKSITSRCGLPTNSLKLIGADELHVLPLPGAKYESVDCALTALKKANMPLKMGFVGNELYESEKK